MIRERENQNQGVMNAPLMYKLKLKNTINAYQAHKIMCQLVERPQIERAVFRLEADQRTLLMVSKKPLAIEKLGGRLFAQQNKVYFPTIHEGNEYRFQIRLSPMKRQRQPKREKASGEIYRPHSKYMALDPSEHLDFARGLLSEAAEILQINMNLEPAQKIKNFYAPSTTFQGRLRVTDPQRFTDRLYEGYGKKRTFGYGMLTIAP